MDNFFDFLYELLKQFFSGFWMMIYNFAKGLVKIFDIPSYIEIFETYKETFNALAWVLAFLAILILLGVIVAIVFLIYRLIRYLTLRVRKGESQDELLNEIGKLNSEVIKLSKEKDKILSLKLAQTGLGKAYDVDENALSSSDDSPISGRFYKLLDIDKAYENYDATKENFNHDITLEQICEQFRNFACSRMGLYYEIRIIRLFLASFASTRLIILQGISGTGKTSLPYAWGKFLENDSQIASVQPSWRDRTELFGYFNEFTKRYNETEVLKRMYEATYTDKVYLTILDEMNIARVEYYFAEMLSILEMPTKDEWVVDLVPSAWPDDPKHIVKGRFNLPVNMWYIGTANNDDSTFAISDKVYDRAMPINIDTKGVKFDAPMTDHLHLDYHDLDRMFAEAKINNKVDAKTLAKIEELDDYVISHFRLAFGNRIVKQLRDFIPAFVACGGTQIDGLDYILTNKIFNKFEGLNLSYIREEIDGLIEKLNELFGEENMGEAKAYLRRLKR